jgi:drug/metabolite transporter (DMT)-like permease
MFAAIAGTTALGFGVAVLAAACYETGYALQAIEAKTAPGEQALRFSLLKTLAQRPRWVIAVALTVAGWPLQLWALSLAPITVVQPTLALGLLLLLALGVKMLGEHVGVREWLAVALVIVGVTTIALSAPPETHSYDAGPSLVVALALLGAATVLPWLVPSVRRKGAFLLVLAAGAADAWAAFASKLITDELHIGRPLAALAWALGAGGAVALGFLCETTALQRRPATRVAPIILVMQIVIPVVLAPLVGGERWQDTPLHGGVIVIGLLLVSAGATVLTSSKVVGDLHAGGELPPAGAITPPVATRATQPIPTASSTTDAADGSAAKERSGSGR